MWVGWFGGGCSEVKWGFCREIIREFCGDWWGLVQLGVIVFGLVMDWRWAGLIVAWLFTGWVGDIWWDRVVRGGCVEGGMD